MQREKIVPRTLSQVGLGKFPLSGCNGIVLFRQQHDTGASPIGLSYSGQYWAVPTRQPCAAAPDPASLPLACDHTMKPIAILALLLNQNKSSRDILKTPAFEALP
jgi:hypothetical protein